MPAPAFAKIAFPKLALVLALLAGCAHVPPTRRDVGTVSFTFAPPPGLVQLEHHLQRRKVSVTFADADPTTVLEMVGGTSEERYQPLPGGDFLVTATVLDESLSRDGLHVTSPLSLEGVAFVHVIDAQGKFVRVEKVEETLSAIRSRVTNPKIKELLDPLLTPEFVTKRVERSWRGRFEQVCGERLAPGASSFAFDEQDLPAGGPARAVVQQQFEGLRADGSRELGVFKFVFGGRGSAQARAPGAQPLLDTLEGGTAGLTERYTGSGERLVVPGTCQTRRELTHVEGEIRLNREMARAAGVTGFPERITFDVHREVWRTLTGEPVPPPETRLR